MNVSSETAGSSASINPSPTTGTGRSGSICTWLSSGIETIRIVSFTGPSARRGASSSSA